MFRATHLPMKMEKTEYSETSAYKIQTPGNYPEENIQQILGDFSIFSTHVEKGVVMVLVVLLLNSMRSASYEGRKCFNPE
jgi:hypothetical protein